MTEEHKIAGYVVYDPVSKKFKKKGSQNWTKNISTCGLYTLSSAKTVVGQLDKVDFAIIIPLYVGDMLKDGTPYCKKGSESTMAQWCFEKECLLSD